ncbi:MAG: UDP-N-acetylglucosamine 1-carboxyvinyltransferase [Candidatus Omnitrophota bacterium]
MDKFVVYKSKLSGEIVLSGSKNAALPIMAATLLTDEPCFILRVPDLADIRTMSKILEMLGKEVIFKDNSLTIKSKKNRSYVAPYRLVKTMRASFCVLGPLLSRRKKAKVSLPGGCVIGVRPVDLHIKGLTALGAKLIIQKGYCIGEAKYLKGTHIFLGGPFGSSVLATANVLMAAVLSRGQTIIEYAACEPEIVDLVLFLRKMGAQIEGEGTNLLKIQGVPYLNGVEHQVISDRIEAGTFIAASMATASGITISGANPFHLTCVIELARKMGAKIKIIGSKIHINGRSPLIKATNITTLPYPGFPTDLQAQFMVCLCLADGLSAITEKIYPDRFMHVAELNRMGARIQRNGPYAIVDGRRHLFGADVMASDLRASAALVIAGLVAQEKTTISRIYHLDRGYEKLDLKLRQLGAKLKREK